MFILFGNEAFYPFGGWYDLQGVFDTIEEAVEADNDRWDFMHIIDANTLECVKSRGGSCYVPFGTVPGEIIK